MNLSARITDWLNVVTLVVAIVSMVLSSMALWPQWKSSLVKLRDGVLWFALIFVIVAIATIGWSRFSQRRAGVPHGAFPNSLDRGADVEVDVVR
jgi:MFS superfamily sulfate permease-like transporter